MRRFFTLSLIGLFFLAYPATGKAGASLTNIGGFGGSSTFYGNMSPDGSVLVGNSKTAGDAETHAYRWRNGVLTDLGTLGGTSSYAAGFTADGNILVGGSALTGDTAEHAYRWTGAVMTDLGTLGGTNSYAYGLSANGLVVSGNSSLTGDTESHAFRWEAGVMTDLGTLGGTHSETYDLSADGAVVAGTSTLAGDVDTHAYRWTGGVMTDLGTLGGSSSDYGGMSMDGSVIAGTSTLAGDVDTHAYRWTGGVMTDLGTLGGSSSSFGRLSDDGSVIAGNSKLIGDIDTHAYRWESGVMTDLGTLGGSFSAYRNMTANGAVVIGNSGTTGNVENHAFRWEAGVMTDLGTLGGTFSNARDLSANGNVIVGNSATAGNASNLMYRWDPVTGMRSLSDILTDAGVDLTGWNFTYLGFPLAVSANGNTISGQALVNGDFRVFIFNQNGVTTPEDLGQSVAVIPQLGNQAATISGLQLSQSLFQARNLMPSAVFAAPSVVVPDTSAGLNDLSAGAGGPYKTLWQMYTTGSAGIGQNNDSDNHDFNGTIGIKAQVTPSIALGGGVIGATAQSQLPFEGNSHLQALGLTGIAAYAPPTSGLRLYGSLFAAGLSMDVRRGYRNGAGLDSSQGSTDGFAYGAAGQVGWSVPVTDRYSVMPYTELRWSRTEIDSYSETGGAFAANFSAQDITNSSARLGLQNDFLLRPDLTLTGRIAYAHRLNGQGSGVTADVGGLTQTIGGGAMGDKNWAEGAIGLGWQVNERTYLSGEINARSGDTPEPAVSAIIGLSVRF